MVRSTAVAVLAGAVVGAAAFGVPAARAQQPQTPEARLVVIGEGTVKVAPDYARIVAGATTRAKTVKEASDINSRIMAAASAALLQSGMSQRDIQSSRFSVQPVYVPQEPPAEPRLTGYSVSNQVSITVRDLGKIGDILDRLITAGVTNVGSISFLVSDQSKALDQGRAAAIADARRKAEIYAQAAQLRVGEVAWVTEDTGFSPAGAARAGTAAPAMATSVPIAPGEDTLRVRITVGFTVVH